MAFMLGKHLGFIDIFQFMSSNLHKLINNLKDGAFKYTSEEIKNNKMLSLLKRKGNHMDNFEKFNETELPKKDEFYSILHDENITGEDYKHAKKVWKAFEIKNMGEYHDLHLDTDVLLLSDVFENFRSTCKRYDELEPSHYFTSPGLSC